MSSKSHSDRSSISSSAPSRPPARALTVSKVSIAEDEKWMLQNLQKNYPNITKISRNHDQSGNPLSSIRIDFNSEETVANILYDGVISLGKREYFVRPYWPLICYRCQHEGHVSSACPQYSLPEWRLAELIDEQNSNFERLIGDFEARWSRRLEKLQTPKPVDLTPLKPVVDDLSGIYQQINQQNVKMQQQLGNLTSRLQNLQTKVSS